MSKKVIMNQKDIARAISRRSGFTVADIEAVLKYENEVINEAISQGVSVKNLKNWKLDVQKKPQKRAYDGLGKKYFLQPAKYVVKFVPLTALKDAINTYNKNNEEENE